MSQLFLTISSLILFLSASITCYASSTIATVKLLLIRDSAAPIKCGDITFIPGILYGVPEGQDLESTVSSLGLQHLTHTQELPYEDNVVGSSSIPPGTYYAKVRNDETKSWMKNKPNRAWRLELTGTNPRSAIQFHYGKDYKWSKGCIILTGENKQLVCDKTSDGSETAVQILREYVESRAKASDHRIEIRIIYAH